MRMQCQIFKLLRLLFRYVARCRRRRAASRIYNAGGRFLEEDSMRTY